MFYETDGQKSSVIIGYFPASIENHQQAMVAIICGGWKISKYYTSLLSVWTENNTNPTNYTK